MQNDRRATADLVASYCVELSVLAYKAGLVDLAYMLDIAKLEAQRAIETESKRAAA